jgi:hypothetical protein
VVEGYQEQQTQQQLIVDKVLLVVQMLVEETQNLVEVVVQDIMQHL